MHGLVGYVIGSGNYELATGSGLTGDWQLEATFGAGAIPNGLAYAADRGVLFAVQVAGNDGELLEIDPATGGVTRTTTLGGLPGFISLAYDPGGAGAADDRLLAVDRQVCIPPAGMQACLAPPIMEEEDCGTQIEELIEIDPDDASVNTLCVLLTNSCVTNFGFFSGLAFDAGNDQLVGAGEAGVLPIPLPSCALGGALPAPAPSANLARSQAALGYEASSGLVHMIGNQVVSQTLFTEIDFGASPDPAVSTTLGIDSMAVGGLAAMPVPEPGPRALAPAALLALAWLRRARRYPTSIRPTPSS